MNVEYVTSDDTVIVRVEERRLVFPQVEAFASAVKRELLPSPRNLIVNLANVDYLDSPAHGYLFDLFRFVTERGGRMRLVGLRARVHSMAALVGLTRFAEALPDERRALEELEVSSRPSPFESEKA